MRSIAKTTVCLLWTVSCCSRSFAWVSPVGGTFRRQRQRHCGPNYEHGRFSRCRCQNRRSIPCGSWLTQPASAADLPIESSSEDTSAESLDASTPQDSEALELLRASQSKGEAELAKGVATESSTEMKDEGRATEERKGEQPWWEPERKAKGLPTLSSATQWRMTLSLRDPRLEGEKGEVTEVAVRVRFDEDSDFEPPQGCLEVIEDNPYFTQQNGKARWTLSEDEDQRSAGLWIWGLFKEPLYPFLLLQMKNLEINLRGGAKIDAGQLYLKVDHRRDEDLGPTLSSGTVGVRLVERVSVDPLGMAEADIASVVPCGTVRFRPV